MTGGVDDQKVGKMEPGRGVAHRTKKEGHDDCLMGEA